MYKTYRDKSFNFNVLEIGREKGGINPPKSLVIITIVYKIREGLFIYSE